MILDETNHIFKEKTDICIIKIKDHMEKRGVDVLKDKRISKSTAFTAEEKEQTVSYTHLRAHETVLDLVCRLLLEKKKKK